MRYHILTHLSSSKRWDGTKKCPRRNAYIHPMILEMPRAENHPSRQVRDNSMKKNISVRLSINDKEKMARALEF